MLLAECIVIRKLSLRPIVAVAAFVGLEIGYGYWSLGRDSTVSGIKVAVIQSERESLPALGD